MGRIGWLTDIHLNFLSEPERRRFYDSLHAAMLDAVLIGGDIGVAGSVELYLAEMEACLAVPIYFVLGNHDFYGGSIAAVRQRVRRQAAGARRLHWLSEAGVIKLSETTALVGHDSWGDGRFGDHFRSDVLLNDFFLIEELRGLDKWELLARLNALGDEAARHLGRVLPEALESFSHVIVLTHVPPFKEACWHEGRISSDDYLPYFASRAVGEALLAAIEARPDRRLTVLCGHTHSPGVAQVRTNLVVYTGGAEYGRPVIQQMLEV
ncbi:MAG: metallophosphoesterase [Acidobacteriota bacterium]